MVATLETLKEQLFDEDVAGRVSSVDSIDGGYLGFNHGRGRRIEVLSEDAMEEMVPDDVKPRAAVDYVTVHEALHDYVSDEDPWEHAAMDVWGLSMLEGTGNYEAVRAGVRLHQERAKTARGRDRQFSRYALAMLAAGSDGGSELSAFGQRYGSGGGISAEGKKKYPWIGDISEFWPLVGYTAKSWLAGRAKNITQGMTGKFWAVTTKAIDAYKKASDNGIETSWNKFAPKPAGIVDMYQGASRLENVWTVDWPSTNYELPVYFQKKDDTLPPDLDGLLEKNIKFIKDEAESVYNKDELKEYFRDKYSAPGAPVQTWGDVPDRCVDPVKTKKWMVRESSELCAQWGPELEVKTLNVDGTNYTVRKRGKSSGMDNLAYLATYWAFYGITNMLGFGPVKRVMAATSDEFGQYGIESQMTATWKILRPLRENPNRRDYQIDLKHAA